jgi:hypothetical protein
MKKGIAVGGAFFLVAFPGQPFLLKLLCSVTPFQSGSQALRLC